MRVTFLGSNSAFIADAFYDSDGNLVPDIVSVTSTEVVVNNAITGAVTTFAGTGFSQTAGGIVAGTITSMTFRMNGEIQAIMDQFSFGAVDFVNVLVDLENESSASAEVFFNSTGFLTLDASNAVAGYDIEETFPGSDEEPFDIFTVPMTVTGSAFNDTLDSNLGDHDDTVNGGGGDDFIGGGQGDDLLLGGNGADTIFADQGNDTITGGRGADIVRGGAGDDVITGGPDDAKDTIEGGSGNDQLGGGDGDDSLSGGAGADDFVFVASFGNDEIIDFEEGVDQIILGGFASGDVNQVINGDDLVLQVSGGNSIEIIDGFADLFDVARDVLFV